MDFHDEANALLDRIATEMGTTLTEENADKVIALVAQEIQKISELSFNNGYLAGKKDGFEEGYWRGRNHKEAMKL